MTHRSDPENCIANSSDYNDEFFAWMDDGSQRSAEVIVPMIMDLTSPSSVVDVGCGTGAWLAEFRRRGVGQIQGIDGAWVPRERLQIPEQCFSAADLSALQTARTTYDLAICLEVAEHLTAEAGEQLVAFLIGSAPVVVFSAAIPGQGGTGHVNEQWLDYWRSEFAEHGYGLLDVIRSRVWADERVEPWYAQNMVVFTAESVLSIIRSRLPGLVRPIPDRVVHPTIFKFAIMRASGI